MDQFFEHPVEMHEHEKHRVGKWKQTQISSSHSDVSSGRGGGDFDCNICLDSVQDPVVTFCGHLFCWPCIYRWINVQSFSSVKSQQHSQCPVCKSEVSERTMIPLYHGGHSKHASNGKSQSLSGAIPERPARPLYKFQEASTAAGSSPGQQLYQRRYGHMGAYGEPLSVSLLGTTDVFHSSSSIFGEMVYHRVFGDHTTLYGRDNSYHQPDLVSPRVRQRVTQMDRSLSRVSFFFLCVALFCLLFF